ncbi:PREDICTED: vesicular glutamate transporter 2.2-like isoform X2 [Branchiostoma belcheri]|uniref:Vesicular glutamate transporter 2.2-like isoform X2 n=1 Tax=Branchiostoma belcheri TaxID=7741 RepID=A0A6P4Y4V2_BRABE|nr:PREDICTED: vesicular glutamate transporter 2.2-like isoform X2 [Branchiostoma belcheri]
MWTDFFKTRHQKEEFTMGEDNTTDAIATSNKLLCLLLFGAILIQYAGRSSVAVVLVELQMPPVNDTNTSVSQPHSQYSQFQVSVIMSIFYLGQLPSSFIGGYLAYRYSAIRIFLASFGAGSIVHVLGPVMFGNFKTAVTQRVLAGLVEKGVPFCHIFTSPAVWASIMLLAASYIWEETLLPLYFQQSFGIQVELVGVISGIPILLFGVLQPLFTLIGNTLCRHVSTTVARKSMAVTGCLVVSGCFLIVAFTSNFLVAVCFIAIGFGSAAAGMAVFYANPFDIAPRYASVLTGTGRVVCRAVGLTFPLLAAELTENKTRQEWSRVVLIKSGFFAATAVVFGVFGSGEEQPWAVVTSLGQKGPIQKIQHRKVDEEKQQLIE